MVQSLLLLLQTTVLLLLVVVVECHDLQSSTDTKILGGSKINISEVPWQVSIQQNGSHLCGGSIISNRWVLSAAHCEITNGNPEFKLLVGSSSKNDKRNLYDLEKVLNHNFDKNTSSHNDICAIKTSMPLVFGDTVKAVSLPKPGMPRPEQGSTLRVSGWGLTEDEEKPEWLRAVDVELVDFELCKVQELVRDPDETSQICAGGRGKNSCGGDSGGPLVKGHLLVGIVSYGPNCTPGVCSYGVYTDVAFYRDWIRTTTGV